jgi:hypothetical protein
MNLRRKSFIKLIKPKPRSETLTNFPKELLKIIFSYLPKTDFLSVRLVCSNWSTSSDLLWEDLYKRTWKVTHNSGASWKYLFLERAQLLNIGYRLNKSSSKIKTLISKRKVGNLINKGIIVLK